MRANIARLIHDVDKLKSTNFSMLFGNMDLPEVPSTYISTISEVPPITTIRNAVITDDDVDSYAYEIHKEAGP